GDDEPVSIRMAKEQSLPLNPVKISGLCGRLMCCLKYEQEQYVRFRKEAPAKGTKVSTPGGDGVIAGYNVTKDSITLKLEDGSFTDVRLDTCHLREDGILESVPVETPPVPVSWLDTPGEIDRLLAAERAADGETVVEAEVVLGENGEPVDVVAAEGSKRSRSRRSRGRRRSKSRVSNDAADGAGASDSRRGAATGRADGGDGAETGAGGRQGGGSQPGTDSAGGGAGSSRSRRRRRPRRSGSGSAGAGSSGANGGGANSGGSGGAGGAAGGGSPG
ncbi:MAG: hypothetical protein JXA57_05655, partial [Armatimonadetes bacterium]|nr:hypothetical protein [Armatimonadota bacterium]